MNTRMINLKDLPHLITINEATTYNIIDLDNDNSDIDVVFDIKANTIINFSSCTYDKNKNIHITINLCASEIDVKLNVNSLTIGNVMTKVELMGRNSEAIKDTNIDMQVSGILSSSQGKMSCVPIYDFNTNLINATHGVTMGTFDEDEIFNLLTKGISSDDAKTMIIWSKFNQALSEVDEKQKDIYYKMILNKWKAK